MPDELQSLLDRVHDGITSFDFDGQETPCIVFEERKFDSILEKVAGKALSIDTDLCILQDGAGHVFVEIKLTFSMGGVVEKILVNANESLRFFELLAKTSILALSSPKSGLGGTNVLLIQMPRPDRTARTLEIIRSGLEGGGAS